MRSASNRVVPDVPSHDRITTTSHAAGTPRWIISSPRSTSNTNTNNNNNNNNGSTPKRKIVRELVSAALLSKPSPLRAPRLFPSLRKNAAHKHELKLERLANQNLTQFLTTACPIDVLPKILAYAGPNAAAALQQTSRHFRTVLNAEGTWRGLCEELYKVRRKYKH